jgi:hypothetical protein
MSVPLLGRALHVRATGGAASLALLRCGAGVRWANNATANGLVREIGNKQTREINKQGTREINKQGK